MVKGLLVSHKVVSMGGGVRPEDSLSLYFPDWENLFIKLAGKDKVGVELVEGAQFDKEMIVLREVEVSDEILDKVMRLLLAEGQLNLEYGAIKKLLKP